MHIKQGLKVLIMKSNNEESQPPIEISPSALSVETLHAVMESFVLREGTDYGTQELSLQTKIDNLKKKMQRKDILLVFDPNTESVTFLTKAEWAKLFRNQTEI